MSNSAVLDKLAEVQVAFDSDFESKGRQLVTAITEGDEAAERRLRQEIKNLHDLRQRFAPVADDMRKYLLDHDAEIHPEDVGMEVLAAATHVGTPEQTIEVPAPLESEEVAEIPQVPRHDIPIGNEAQEEHTERTESEDSAETASSSKDYNKSDVYRPFLLEAIHALPGAKLADLQRKTHELMFATKIEGVRIGKEGDKKQTNSGVYRYKAQTQSLRKKFEQEKLIEVQPDGAITLTPEGDKLRWGKLKPRERKTWALEMGIIAAQDETTDE